MQAMLADFPAIYGPVYLLIFVRISAAFVAAPVLGSRLLPMPLRIGLALLIAVVMIPVVPVRHVPSAVPEYVLALAREAAIGLLAGFGLHLVFLIIQFTAGTIGVQMGLSLPSGFDAYGVEQEIVLERFMVALATLVFLQVDGLHLFLLGLQSLFLAFPVGDLSLPSLGAEKLIDLFSNTFVFGMRLAMPMLGALLVADVGLAIAARAVPQLNLFAVGIPVKIALGIFGLSVSLPPLLTELSSLFRRLLLEMGIWAG